MATIITGTMLTPGVSLNKRLYTREQIAKTVSRMRERIADPGGLPINMRTHHDAGDDSLRIVGRVTNVQVNPKTGEADYKAVLNTSTEAGHDLWQLVKDRKNPLLDSTSIYGWWLGEVRQISHEGQTVETGDDLEVDAIDFTGSPGVAGARIRTVSTEQRDQESARGRHIVTETITASAVITEEAPEPGGGEPEHVLTEDGTGCATCLAETPTNPKSKRGSGLKGKGGVQYADPGYQSDGKQRYELDTPAHIRAAWSFINQSDNQKPYTAQQVAAIKGRIKSAAKKAGIDISSDKETSTRRDVLGETRIGGVTEWMGMNNCCGFSIAAFNGPLTVSISAYDGIDPGDLPLIAKAAMDAACQAIQALDPDTDGDIDKPGASASTSEGGDKSPGDTATDLAGDTLSPDDEMETRTYSVQATARGPMTINISSEAVTPDPRQVAAAIARRKATVETAPAAEPPRAPGAPEDPPADAPADAPPTDTAPAAPDSSAPDKEKEQTTMPDQNAATEETTAPPPATLNEDALKAFASALGPVIGTAVETAISKALADREPAKPAAPAAAEATTATATEAAKGSDVTGYADAVKTALDGLPGALAEAIKPLMCQCAPAAETAAVTAPAATEGAAAATPAAETRTATEAAAEAVDPKLVALEAARLAIPELLDAFGVPRRKGLIPSTEHRGTGEKQQTPEELWANRGAMWDQLIPQAPAAVQPTPAALAAAGAAPAA